MEHITKRLILRRVPRGAVKLGVWTEMSGPVMVCAQSVMFFPKNNQRTAPTESPMMATSPLFSATLTTSCLLEYSQIDLDRIVSIW